ncbi:MAG: molybdopterin-synthase adenylyltransferase MoeB [Candidatus Dormibacteraeota bacterium]|uniref:Molybdopterin-synthase adenylyltransferase MoeB n=1 Tax=Candidatus Aeolococcus gillhamiae TaxID=3127015 RepID=A0A2W5ZFW1_9BACT|nr:molybdopterin-synthase adenylyltransferase MoeB [Candidatus Dormibacteraeota bacterium]PZR84369.1 MAG: molybdopterin-synthase adenylyltransferase MoeB [Candidatus Dormibacter sp. RRmetagenome_bin12]
MPSSRDLLDDARRVIPEVTPQQVARERGSRTVIDVRERDEFEAGFIPGAQHLSKGFIEVQIEDRVPARDTPITLYCAGGVRSLLAAKALHELGYSDVRSMSGGFNGWKQAGFDFEIPHVLSADQKRRYSRHLLIPEIGEEGQAKLLDAKVLLIGAGGLGSPVALYLAAAGVGTIGLVDFDVVDDSNLQRQIIHTRDRVGMRKTESARIAINALNSDVRVVDHNEMLSGDNARALFDQYDIIVNGCDNFPTRYLANDVALFARKPLVDGGIFRFEGQVTTILPFASPCYRCRYPSPPPPEEAPSCAEAGVLGVLPGIVGTLQATEVVKLIVGIGDPLAGRLLHIDALDMRFREFRIPRDPDCPVCGENPTITEPIDYEGFCMVPAGVATEAVAAGV